MNFRLSITLFGLLSLGFASAVPGEIVPFKHPEFRAVGSVVATAVSEDKEVFIAGDFDEVDGIPRPGLAKLTSNGSLDQSFEPTVTLGQIPFPLFGPSSYRPTQSFFGSGNYPAEFLADRPGGFRTVQLFDLGRNRLFLRNQSAWTVLDPEGKIDPTALPTFPRTDPAPIPQFRFANRLYLINDARRLVVVDLENNEVIDETFTLDPALTSPVLQAIRTGDGIWIMSRERKFDVIHLVNLDGSLDEGFPPLELRDGLQHELRSGGSSAFAIVGRFTGPFTTCAAVGGCGPPSNFFKVTWFHKNGGEESEVTVRFRGHFAQSILLGSYSRITYQVNQNWYTRSSNSEPTKLEMIEAPGPDRSPDLPLHVTTIDQVKGGPFRNQAFLVGGTRLFDFWGQPSVGWNVPRLTRTGTVQHVIPRPDGSYFASGDFGSGLVKVTTEGEIDPAFTPDLDLRFLHTFKVKTNGEIFALLRNPTADSGRSTFRLVRLSRTGKLLQSYLEQDYFFSVNRTFQIVLLEDQSLIFGDGSFEQTVSQFGQLISTSSYRRIRPNGEIDPNWKITDPRRLGLPTLPTNTPLMALHDGSFLYGRFQVSAEGIMASGIQGEGAITLYAQDPEGWVYFAQGDARKGLQRWKPKIGIDPNFHYSIKEIPHYIDADYISGMTFGSRGKIYLHGQFPSLSGLRSLVRLHRTGQIDRTFREPDLRSRTAPRGTAQVLTPDGLKQNDERLFSTSVSPTTSFISEDRLIVFGFFDLPSENVVALKDFHVSGYEEWITAMTGESQPANSDFDQDGTSNLQEYAIGSDPAFPDLLDQRVEQSNPSVFAVPCNPEAPEIVRQILVSNEMETWRTATAAEVTLDTRAGCFRYWLDASGGRLFSRIRYSLR